MHKGCRWKKVQKIEQLALRVLSSNCLNVNFAAFAPAGQGITCLQPALVYLDLRDMLEQWQNFSSSFTLPKLRDFFDQEIIPMQTSGAPGDAVASPTPPPLRTQDDYGRPVLGEEPYTRIQDRTDRSSEAPRDESHAGAFSSLLSEATLEAGAPGQKHEFSAPGELEKTRQSHRPVYMPDMRMDEEDAEEHDASTPFPAAAGTDTDEKIAEQPSDLLNLQVATTEIPHWLQMSSEGLVSQWAPFSSYAASDTNLIVRPPPMPEEECLALLPPEATPEGFRVLSVKHQESLSRGAISHGKCFYFDAAAFPSYEFTPHPCFVEQWRGGLLLWSGAVTLSLGTIGAVDLPPLTLPAFGRKEPRSVSQLGDFEVDDIIFVLGFHKDFAVSVGRHLGFSENLLGYQSYCMGKRASPRQDLDTFRKSAKYIDELGDLGKHVQINVEVDEKELVAIRGTTESRANMGAMLEPSAHVEDTTSVAELDRENSLVMAGVEVAEEGTIPHTVRSSTSSDAWNARRQAMLNARPRHAPDREATL